MTARGLLREREPAKTEGALDLLRRAVELDPGYAPAWASLGVAVKLHWWDKNEASQLADRDPAFKEAAVAEATRHARRALELAPDLPEAHAALGMIRDFDRQGMPHLERALRLDSNNAEAWYWLYNVRQEALDFEGALQAIRRSVAIDPFWSRNGWFPALAWEMGYRDEALRYMRRMIEKPRSHSIGRLGEVNSRWPATTGPLLPGSCERPAEMHDQTPEPIPTIRQQPRCSAWVCSTRPTASVRCRRASFR